MYDENGVFCVFTPNESESAMKTGIFAFCAQPYMYHFVRREPYTVRHAILHNVGFHVGFYDQTLHTPTILVLNTKRAKCSEISETFNETINGH